MADNGSSWAPIGQNDAITWPDLEGIFRQKNLRKVEAYLAYLAGSGVTCLRLMLEYSQTNHRFLEKPAGSFQPDMVRLWDDLFYLCGKYGLRIFLTPYDTFWMWKRWAHHPYNKTNGGPCKRRTQWLLCPDTLNAIKRRLAFAAQRWGGSGVLFAWDLWNELHPNQAGNTIGVFDTFVEEISTYLRNMERKLFGRSHPQTVSVFSTVLEKNPEMADIIFRHPSLNFASMHLYALRTIDYPKNTVAPAISTGTFIRHALDHIGDMRPFLDSEHGPIGTYKRKLTLPQAFDEEYFRHMQWAHLASGGAGGGMRWPYRRPHSLTVGMRTAQRSMAAFMQLINWNGFRRKNLNAALKISSRAFTGFACGDKNQAIVWLLRKDCITSAGIIDPAAIVLRVKVGIPDMGAGKYKITGWDTQGAKVFGITCVENLHVGTLMLEVLIRADLALAVQRVSGGANSD